MSKTDIKPFTKKDFIRFARESVVYAEIPEGAKNEVACRRMNAFALINSTAQISQKNFGNDVFSNRNKETQYQRNKERFPFTALIEVSGKIDRLKNKSCCSYEIAFGDAEKRSCKNCGYCNKRNDEERFCDLMEMAQKFFRYLETQICLVRPYNIVDGSKVYLSEAYSWESEAVLNHLMDQEKISGYDKHFVGTQNLRKSLKQNNKILQFRRSTFLDGTRVIHIEKYTICENLSCLSIDWEVHDSKQDITLECC